MQRWFTVRFCSTASQCSVTWQLWKCWLALCLTKGSIRRAWHFSNETLISM